MCWFGYSPGVDPKIPLASGYSSSVSPSASVVSSAVSTEVSSSLSPQPISKPNKRILCIFYSPASFCSVLVTVCLFVLAVPHMLFEVCLKFVIFVDVLLAVLSEYSG